MNKLILIDDGFEPFLWEDIAISSMDKWDKMEPDNILPYRKRLPVPITLHYHGHTIVFLLRFTNRRQ